MDQMHEKWMKLALDQAEIAFKCDEVPIGAIVVQNDSEVISAAYNLKHTQNIATSHAEVLAIEAACKKLGRWRLTDCKLYVTLEPCLMCAGAIIQARLKTVIFATSDPKAGACKSLYKCLEDNRLNHNCEVIEGPLKKESALLLKTFFQRKRKKDTNE